MARQITNIEPNEQNPAISRATFDDGSIYTMPSENLQQLYAQQQTAQRAQMLASNAGMNFGNIQPQQPSARPSVEVDPGAWQAAQQQALSGVSPVPAAPPGQPNAIPETTVAAPAPSAGMQEVHNIQQAGYRWTARDEAESRLHPELSRAQILAGRTQTPYQPKITQEQWQAKSQQGTVLPTASSTTVADKVPGVTDEDIKKVVSHQLIGADQTALALGEESKARAEIAHATYLESQSYADKMAAEQAHHEALWQQQWGKFNAQFDPNNEENKVDPHRFFRTHGAIGGALAILGGAFGAYANAMAGRPWEQTPIDKIIANDIQAQMQDIQTRRGAANNQLMALSQQFGSLQAGAAALKIAQLRAIDGKLGDLAAVKMGPADAAKIEATRQALQGEAAKLEPTLKALWGGRISQTSQGQVVYPQSARGGGTAYSEKALQGMGKEGRAEHRQDVELGIKAGEAGQKTVTAEQAQKLGEYSDVKDRVIELAKMYGLRYNAKTGQVEKPDGWENPLSGVIAGESMLSKTRHATDQQQAIRANTDQIIPLYTHAQMGRVTEQDLAIAHDNFYGQNPAQTPEALNAILKTVNTEINSWGGAVTPGQRVNVARGIRREQDIGQDEPLAPKVK